MTRIATATKSRSKPAATPLTPEEAALLAEHELTISQGLGAFVAVGQAILEVRDKKLYRGPYGSIEDYLEKRWDISRSRGYQLMQAAEIAVEMSTNGGHLENERQARALAAVPPHLRKDVIDQAKAAGEELTEQVVNRIVCKLLDDRRAAAAEASPKPGSAATEDEDEEETEEDAQDEDTDTDEEPAAKDEEEDASEPTTSGTLRRAAKKAEKQRLYLARGLEHLRLAVKDLRKVDASDLETATARQALRDALSAADEVFSDVRIIAADEEKRAA